MPADYLPDTETLTAQQTADSLGISATSVRKAIKAGDIAAVWNGRRYDVLVEPLRQWISAAVGSKSAEEIRARRQG